MTSVVQQHIRRHPDQLQVTPPLTQHLVSGRERDQMREPLQRDSVTVADQLRDAVLNRRELSHDVRYTWNGSVPASVWTVQESSLRKLAAVA
jgi:hypothetical protein